MRIDRIITAMTLAALMVWVPLKASAETQRRIVVLGGDLTEIVYALGGQDALVGVDTTSRYPEAASGLPNVGYVRAIAPEGVLTLSPDLIVAANDAGPPAAMDKLRAAGVEIAVAPEGDSIAGILAKVAFLGDVLGRPDRAADLAKDIDAAMRAIRVEETGVSAAILMAGRGGSMIAAGEGTSGEAMLALAGGRNALAGFTGFKPVSAEAMLAAAPDVLIVPSHVVDALGGLDKLMARPEIAATPATPAGQAGRVTVIDAMLLLGFGPRTPQAVKVLADALNAAR